MSVEGAVAAATEAQVQRADEGEPVTKAEVEEAQQEAVQQAHQENQTMADHSAEGGDEQKAPQEGGAEPEDAAMAEGQQRWDTK